MKEQLSISKHELKEKLYDFAVSNGNGLCADVIAECEYSIQNPEEDSSMLFGVSDLGEFPTLDCMHLIENEGKKIYSETRESAYFRTSNNQNVVRVTPTNNGAGDSTCFDMESLQNHHVLKQYYNVLRSIVPSLASSLLQAHSPNIDP